MQYRKFGRLDWQVSVLGFGAMRLPMMNDAINEPEAITLIRTALDQGVNYIDTAYVYHGGQSEIVVGKALQNGYRSKVKLATKSPLWSINETADFDRILQEQLQKLQTEQIDFYLFHGLSQQSWEEKVLKLNLLEKAEAALKDGRIAHIGFSFHDRYPAFTQIVDGYDRWSFCQIQYNYMDIHSQAGVQGLHYAAERGLAVIVMEPMLGGKLSKPPAAAQAVFDAFPTQHTPTEWALQWLWNQPEISTVLSGMSTLTQVEENLRAADNAGSFRFGPEEQQLIATVSQKIAAGFPIPCTRCGYCLPCPQGLDIPRNFEVYNHGFGYDDLTGSRTVYRLWMSEEERAGQCIQCGICETKCPQKLAIRQWMPQVHTALTEAPG